MPQDLNLDWWKWRCHLVDRSFSTYNWWWSPGDLVVIPYVYFTHIFEPFSFEESGDSKATRATRMGGTCAQCKFFKARCDLESGKEIPENFTYGNPLGEEHEFLDEIRYPDAVSGQCLYFHPVVVDGVMSTFFCPYYSRQNEILQFKDDAIELPMY